MTGQISNIQRYSVHDGPGIRTTVFLMGCPLSCWWCQNPEGRSDVPEIGLIESRCIRCGECGAVCPGVMVEPEGVHDSTVRGQSERRGAAVLPARGTCSRCGACVEACPTGARQWTGRAMTVEEVVVEIAKDRVFYNESGGGVTFSGGEPMLQPGFLLALLGACRACGIHTAVDTSGYARREDLLAVAEATDLFLFDMKLMDDVRHARYTGVSNSTILDNLATLGAVHDNIWIRVPIIPGVNDDRTNLDLLARFVSSIPGVRQVNLLPYHETGLRKFERLGEPYLLGHVDAPSPGRLEELTASFRAVGLLTRTGG